MKNILTVCLFLATVTSAAAFKKKEKETNKVLLETTAGNITIQLYEDVPLHTANFKKLVKEGFYDSLLFHRVIPSFMIQGGDPGSKNAPAGTMLGNGDIGYTIPAEFNVTKYIHIKGALAAARTPNPEKASSGCQFYIVEGRKWTDAELTNFEQSKGMTYTPEQREQYKTLGGTPHLDNEYTVYGIVLEGLDIITKIANAPRNPQDRPNEDIRIIRAVMVK